MDTATRLIRLAGRKPTPAQRRRIIKKAGRDPMATVVKDDGMGYPPSKQGYRELVGFGGEDILAEAAPVSGAPR
jgi:hypothetical protein